MLAGKLPLKVGIISTLWKEAGMKAITKTA